MISNPAGQNSTFSFYGKSSLTNMFFVPSGKKKKSFVSTKGGKCHTGDIQF